MSVFTVTVTSIPQRSLAKAETDALSKQLREIAAPLSTLCNLEKAKIKASDLRIDRALDLATRQYLPSENAAGVAGLADAAFVVMVAFDAAKVPSGFAILSVPVRASKHYSYIYNPAADKTYNLNNVADIIYLCGSKGATPSLLFEMTKAIDADAFYLEVAGGRQTKGGATMLYKDPSKLPAIVPQRKKLAELYEKKYGFQEVVMLYGRGKQDKKLERFLRPEIGNAKDGYFVQTENGVPYSMLVERATLMSRLAGYGFRAEQKTPVAAPNLDVEVPALPPPVLTANVLSPLKASDFSPLVSLPTSPATPPPAKKAPRKKRPSTPPASPPRKQPLRPPPIELPPEPPLILLPPAPPQKAETPPQKAPPRKQRQKKSDEDKAARLAAQAAAQPAAETPKKEPSERRYKRLETYNTYLYRLLKEIHPGRGLGMSRRALAILNSMLSDIFDRLGSEAAFLNGYVYKQRTMTKRDIQTAVRLLFPSDLAKHAVSDGTKAVAKYESSKS